MVRAPCCEKMGMKRGPWTKEEDEILVSYIQRHGHGNWRALPKLAGLLRCGKSCRLRWTNYLRPDIKRGNFSEEEEEAIISLHEILGNRWSAIAARLPGRTDNEIKNVWHTRLKKRSNPAQPIGPKRRRAKPEPKAAAELGSEPGPVTAKTESATAHSGSECCSASHGEFSPLHTDSSSMDFSSQELQEIDEGFWNEVLSMESCAVAPAAIGDAQLSLESLSNDEDVEFWLRIFMEVGELPEL